MQIVKIKHITHYGTEDLPFTHAQATDPANVLQKKGGGGGFQNDTCIILKTF